MQRTSTRLAAAIIAIALGLSSLATPAGAADQRQETLTSAKQTHASVPYNIPGILALLWANCMSQPFPMSDPTCRAIAAS